MEDFRGHVSRFRRSHPRRLPPTFPYKWRDNTVVPSHVDTPCTIHGAGALVSSLGPIRKRGGTQGWNVSRTRGFVIRYRAVIYYD